MISRRSGCKEVWTPNRRTRKAQPPQTVCAIRVTQLIVAFTESGVACVWVGIIERDEACNSISSSACDTPPVNQKTEMRLSIGVSKWNIFLQVVCSLIWESSPLQRTCCWKESLNILFMLIACGLVALCRFHISFRFWNFVTKNISSFQNCEDCWL
jgi:hypothetical protein